ncbi:PREDICTED: uncharacterized protein LOC105450322 [Wasmannia auropunctata]|uniref:uncharacterized protein LOC105450322 n=1 Tax=Wasmannia auropunctata TaxID=64793 RepID=UPI0005F00A32|nr:PREDICTED: uncharacterized protein LOC105450322 [Wasmannia auropunctata]
MATCFSEGDLLSANINTSGPATVSGERLDTVNVTRIKELKESIDAHNNAVVELLISNKDLKDKRVKIESAFRACKEAFVEVSAAYVSLLENGMLKSNLNSIKSVVGEAVSEVCNKLMGASNSQYASRSACAPTASTYAAVAATQVSTKSSVKVARGPSIEIPKTTNLIITPAEDSVEKYASSNDTREAFRKIIKPADFNLRVKKISAVKKSGIRIEALTVDLSKMMNSSALSNAGLRLIKETRVNPRMLVQGVPSELTKKEIKADIMALNLENEDAAGLRIIYKFPVKKNRRTTSCIIEVSLDIRVSLLKDKHIFVGYHACKISDYVRVLQCFKCLAFGHFAENCKSSPLCGHCAGSHEMRDNKKQAPSLRKL